MRQDRRGNRLHDVFGKVPVHLLEKTDHAFEQVLATHLKEAGNSFGQRL